MYIDLEDKVTRFLVQEYVNKICYYSSEKELNSNVHKLIHTFDVADMAQQLIKLTEPTLSEKVQKQILNAAILHDIGRCHEFKDGIHLKDIDHGKIGAELIEKKFPEMEIEAQSTFYHNKLPSAQEPDTCHPVLEYVRDADVLANIQYEILHADTWIHHNLVEHKKEEVLPPEIDDEIVAAVHEKRLAKSAQIKHLNLLTEWLWQLCWYFNVATDAGKKLAHQAHLFERFRDMICEKAIPLTTKDEKQQTELIRKIRELFPDSLFV